MLNVLPQRVSRQIQVGQRVQAQLVGHQRLAQCVRRLSRQGTMGQIEVAQAAREMTDGSGNGAHTLVLHKVKADVDACEVTALVGSYCSRQPLEEVCSQPRA